MKVTHVEPESILRLSVTCTELGFGVIDPLNPTEEAIEIEDVDTEVEIDVDIRKFAVSVIGPFMVIDGLPRPENEPEPLPIHPTKE
jgi:hypothetical protein